ncbi:MAG: hypothetical protein A2275_05260 [Bacteroidetes bacterium RIFOXYA12_FULL_35_11]|nr:MAG: hypothetical protein A2X01_18475 [Bacteroidetes bacterium GWF2_35_48]OFY74314.1 MAG: hypothetical protein A2275_05260 [Bacteroidetes bacterium RIFOXYA12_FULL_35_11]
MSTNHESGHAINIANMELLASICVEHGESFNPSKSILKLDSVNPLIATAKTTLEDLKEKFTNYTKAVDAREELFEPLSKFVTRLMNSLASSDAPEKTTEDAKTISRKIEGQRATKKSKNALDAFIESTHKVSADIENTTNPAEVAHKEISASQMSFDNRVDNFEKLVSLLASETGFAPNEADLKVTALNVKLSDLKAKNSAVVSCFAKLSKSRIERNKILYDEKKGLYEVAMEIKAYIKSVFGATSPEYKQVSKIKFTKPR